MVSREAGVRERKGGNGVGSEGESGGEGSGRVGGMKTCREHREGEEWRGAGREGKRESKRANEIGRGIWGWR